MKIVFMGTPDFAISSFYALIESGYEISGVFTRPDKPKNRGQKIQMTPVKEAALQKGIEVYQPLSLKKGEDAEKAYEILKKLNPDCIVVVAYGQILPKSILDLPKYGCINVHASLLPLYRGAAPINASIMNGDKESGVSVMYMSEGLDCGDVILEEKTEITDDMTATELHDILSKIGGRILITALSLLKSNKAVPMPQNNEKASYASMITKESCRINWELSGKEIRNKIRGLAETPGAFTFVGNKRLKVYFAEINNEIPEKEIPYTIPGTVISEKSFTVLCGGRTFVTLTDVQLEGGKRMDGKTFLRGRKIPINTILGT